MGTQQDYYLFFIEGKVLVFLTCGLFSDNEVINKSKFKQECDDICKHGTEKNKKYAHDELEI